MDNTIDARLMDLYNEYVSKDKEYEFINMLYALLDMVTGDIRRHVYYARAAWKRKLGAAGRKIVKEKIDNYFSNMTFDELIKYQNMPWHEIPGWLREAMPAIVKNPEECNDTRIFGLVDKDERQQETVSSRILRVMNEQGFITADENGKAVIHAENFAEVCNKLAKKYDLEWLPNKNPQKTRLTGRDFKNYIQRRVSPKGDKKAVITVASKKPLYFINGYGGNKVPASQTGSHFTRYRKPRTAA